MDFRGARPGAQLDDLRTDWLTSFEGNSIELHEKFQLTAELVAAHRERCV